MVQVSITRHPGPAAGSRGVAGGAHYHIWLSLIQVPALEKAILMTHVFAKLGRMMCTHVPV